MSLSIVELEELARKCRVEIVKMVHRAWLDTRGLAIEIDLISALYANYMRIKPDEPNWDDRDRFILSKGHASPGMYAILAEMGFIAKKT